ncbi:MAG: hypothetical protein RMK19_06940 [Bacteroidia bacterium]|nr:hypothetical protein [Bacteroidia bacterium]MDW8015732.1 hypothetical protein [Bacteroidia bacterium]
MESLLEIEARLRRIEEGLRRWQAACEEALNNQNALILAQRRQRERLKKRLVSLREKIQLALSHGRRDSNMDHIGATTDSSGVAPDDSAAG